MYERQRQERKLKHEQNIKLIEGKITQFAKNNLMKNLFATKNPDIKNVLPNTRNSKIYLAESNNLNIFSKTTMDYKMKDDFKKIYEKDKLTEPLINKIKLGENCTTNSENNNKIEKTDNLK